MSTRICCVRSCNKTRGDKCILHKFPDPNNDFERFKAWVNFIDGDLFSLGSDIMYENYRLCESHFEPKFKSTSGRVTRNAVPTLLLSGIPLHWFLNPVTNAKKIKTWISHMCGDIAQDS